MFSLLASYNQARLQSKLQKAQASVLRANAKGTRNRAKAQATAIQKSAQDNQLLAAQNLMTAQANKRLEQGKVITAQAYSGFDADKGTGGQTLANLQQQLDAQIANMELSASINMLNAWQSSIDTQRQGEIDAYTQESQADQLQAAAKATRRSANLSLISGIANAAVSGYQGYQSGLTHNQNLQKLLDQGTINQAAYDAYKVNPYSTAFSAASAGGYQGFHFVNSLNPYTAALSADANRKNNWGGLFSVLEGKVPYKIPAAGTIFAQY